MKRINKYIKNSRKKIRGFTLVWYILTVILYCYVIYNYIFKENRYSLTEYIAMGIAIFLSFTFIIKILLNTPDVIGDFNHSIVILSQLWVYTLAVLFLAWFHITGLKTIDAYGSSFILICIFYFVAPFWVVYFLSCRKVLKSIHKSSALLKENTVRSILIANTAWLTLFDNLLSKYYASITYVTVISIFVSTVAAAYYPLLDMYKFTRTKLDEYEKEKSIEAERKRKEEIENESNGSKNYTA